MEVRREKSHGEETQEGQENLSEKVAQAALGQVAVATGCLSLAPSAPLTAK
jgi:hypothetical protein